MDVVTIVGAGLAGCEAALQCARRGVPVRLIEMRPLKMTEAHETGDVAELVCSNSLKSDEQTNAHGLLKAELRVLDSVLLECAERARVPGGKALVVDRRRFSAEVQRALDDAGVEVVRQEVTEPDFTTKAQRHKAEPDDPEDETATKTRKTRNGPEGRFAAYGDMERGESPAGQDSVSTTKAQRHEGEPARGGKTEGGIMVVATGPLTSQTMADALQSLFGVERLFFHDAIAPIVSAESLDMARIFEGSRYGAGDGEKLDVRCEMSDVRSEDSQTRTASGYLNCPMSEEEYERFVTALLEAELYPLHEFESALADLGHDPKSEEDFGHVPRRQPLFFEGCLPVEEIARRGRLSLAYGPMKPVGLVDPRGHDPKSHEDFGHVPKRPFAVVQLRRENAEGTMYNIVGFQTRLRQGEQERVFRMIPGLENATFLRFGSIHRNTYIDSPRLLLPTLQAKIRPYLLIAGQLTGVEGYVESIGAGLVAGINAARLAKGEEPVVLPREMMMGSLLRYVTGAAENQGQSPAARTRPQSGTVPVFQPMNANFGLLPGLEKRLRGRDKRSALAERALEAARGFALTVGRERA